jgi:hypothetical protein
LYFSLLVLLLSHSTVLRAIELHICQRVLKARIEPLGDFIWKQRLCIVMLGMIRFSAML